MFTSLAHCAKVPSCFFCVRNNEKKVEPHINLFLFALHTVGCVVQPQHLLLSTFDQGYTTRSLYIYVKNTLQCNAFKCLQNVSVQEEVRMQTLIVTLCKWLNASFKNKK